MTKRTATNGEVSKKGLARMPIDLGPLFIEIQSYVDAAFAVENAALIAERDALAADNDVLVLANEALIAEVQTQQAQIATLNSMVDTLEGENETLQNLIAGKDAIIAEQIAEISAKNTEIATLRWDLELESERRLELESQVADLNAQIADLQAQLAGAMLFPVITSVSDLTVNETTSSAVFTVTMDRMTTRAVNIDYTTVNGTAIAGQDYTATSGILVIAPGLLSATITVPIINDANVESNEAFTLALSNPRLSLAINDSTGSGTIISEDVTQPPPPVGSIPLTFNDARFSGNTTSTNVTISGGTLANKTITATGSTASIVVNALAIVQTCRVNSRECIRVTAGVDVRNCYLEATGTGADHADVIQTYSPGQSNGVLKVTDTAIVAHNTAATAGLFVADSWGGTVTLLNVMFQGGPYGCRIHADPGKTVNVSMENVFFVGPFNFGSHIIESEGGTLNITKWVNVRNATIVNGALVPGSLITSP